MIRLCVLFLLTIYYPSLVAGFYFHYGFNIDSFSDTKAKLSFNTMKNNFFIGAFVGPSKVVVFGQDVTYWSVQEQNSPATGTTTEKSSFSLLQLGPRMIIYMGSDNEYYISAAYHPYAQGKRKIGTAGVQEKVSGSGYIGTFGYHLKVTKVFHLGASLNYHALTLKESIVGSEATKVSYSYSTYYPMVELSFRF